ncbi:hypothetical protein JCM33374_g4349 [Metschnikowia sp. JCM 33374]|nr:hypothetical protein JCM33374_g4349 [Metschnikowia sp. JCM 33374]
MRVNCDKANYQSTNSKKTLRLSVVFTSSRDITTQIQNGMNRSFQSTEESIDLTNEEGIEEEEISNTSRMSFDYLCEDSNS